MGENRTAGLDDFVRPFEEAWSRHGFADLGEFLPPAGHPLFVAALGELVCVDIELRWQLADPRPLDDYLRRFPALAADPVGLRRAAHEEYRQRHQAGQSPDPAEYETRYGVGTAEWFRPAARSDAETGPPDETPHHPAVTLVAPAGSKPTADLSDLLRRRLRLIGTGAVGVLFYFTVLVLLTPHQKVGLFLERPTLVVLNWLLLLVCGGLAGLLWSRRPLSVPRLRQIELTIVGLLLTELALGLFSDLFLDDELRQPLAEGDHALFHYASSWSLPFFALIVGYGTLVPTTGRRCAVVVGVMAVVPLAISLAAGIATGAVGRPFLMSFLLQMTLWMVAAAAVAAYGAYRISVLQREASEARRLGQYRLVRRLGGGGMGEVFLAEHVLLRRPCAVKVIRPELAGDPRTLQRFEREARAAARLTHPNTCTVFDYGTATDGTFYIAMEYLPGETLDEIVGKSGPLSPGWVVRLLRQVCGALAEAHRAGMVHRDVKPGNVLVCERGGVADVAKLLDFGLVQGLGGPGGGREALFAGTPSYASPEQAEGYGDLDARTDVYSLGAVAYFLLTGRPPFQGTSAADTLAAHVLDPVTPPRAVRPDVPEDLERVVLRCLEKDPDRRFPDAGELDLALTKCRQLGEDPASGAA